MTGTSLSDLLRQLDEDGVDIMALLVATEEMAGIGQGAAAATLYHAWIRRYPEHPLMFAVQFNFGTLWAKLNQPAQAAAAFQQAIALNPDFLSPYINLGNIFEQAKDRPAAVAQWTALTERLPQITRENLDFKLMALKQIGRVLAASDLDDGAERALKLSLDLDDRQPDVQQHWFNLRQRQCRWPLLAPVSETTARRVLAGMSPLSLASYSDDPFWQLGHAAAFTLSEIGRPAPALPDRAVRLRQKIRVGYLSSDLCEHAIGYLTAEIYSLHNRDAFEIIAYYTGHRDEDRIQKRIRGDVDLWRDIHDVTDPDAARLIQADEIDILIDLNGHTKDARTALLACNPAPIIVNWLGFPGSMGSAFHHYIIADPFIIPPGSERFYSETVLRLPCYQPTDRKRLVASEIPERAEAGLPPDAMVFCCFNEPRKITAATWKLWIQILQNVPDSVLWLLVPAANTQSHLRHLAEEAGVAASRLVFAPRAHNPDHVARYQLADLILDSFPYGAHTTASDALWMGIPVVTRVGLSFASRVCGSLLRAAGLPELACDTEEQYRDIAIALGKSSADRLQLRERLARGRQHCLLFDTPKLVLHLEDLYRQIWADHLGGKTARPNLANLPFYQDIGIERDHSGLAETTDLLGHYRAQMAQRRFYLPIMEDRRLLASSSG